MAAAQRSFSCFGSTFTRFSRRRVVGAGVPAAATAGLAGSAAAKERHSARGLGFQQPDTTPTAVWRFTDGRRRPGLLTGVFCVGYGAARIVGELFREPDAHLGYLWGPLTMGMLLSVPMLAFGAWLIGRAYTRPALP